jgi:hypothetical protein
MPQPTLLSTMTEAAHILPFSPMAIGMYKAVSNHMVPVLPNYTHSYLAVQ